MENEQNSQDLVKNEELVTKKKAYKAPTLTEYGLITDLVNLQFRLGQDGGGFIDSQS